MLAIGCGDDEMNPLAPSPIGAADAGLAPMGDGGGAAPSGAAAGGIENPAAPSMTGPLGGGRMSTLGTGTTCEAAATGAHWNAIRGKPLTGGVGAIRTRVKATFEGTDTLTRAGVCEMAKANVQAGTFGDAGPWCGARGHTADWEAAYAELDRLETCRATPPQPTVNNTPTVSNWPATLNLETGAAAHTITLSSHFSDADDDALTYTVSATGSAATAAISSGTLTITPVQVGTSTVTVTASDGDASVAGKTTVTVTAPPQPQVRSDLTGSGTHMRVQAGRTPDPSNDCSDLHLDLQQFNGIVLCDIPEDGGYVNISMRNALGGGDWFRNTLGLRMSGGGCNEGDPPLVYSGRPSNNNVVSYNSRPNHWLGTDHIQDAWDAVRGIYACGSSTAMTVVVRSREDDTVTVDIGHRGEPSEQRATYVRASHNLGISIQQSAHGRACWVNPVFFSSVLGGSIQNNGLGSASWNSQPGWIRGEIRFTSAHANKFCDAVSQAQFNPGDWKIGADASFNPTHNVVLPFHRCQGFIEACDGWLDGKFVAVLMDGALVDERGPARWRWLDGATHQGISSYRWRRKGVGSWQPSNSNREMFPCNGFTYEIVSPIGSYWGRHFVSIEGGPPRPFWNVTIIEYSC